MLEAYFSFIDHDTMIDMEEFRDAFIKEAREMMERILLALSVLAVISDDHEKLSDIMRVFHNVRGISDMMGRSDIALQCHEMELLYQTYIKNGTHPSKEDIEKTRTVTTEILSVLVKEAEKCTSNPTPPSPTF